MSWCSPLPLPPASENVLGCQLSFIGWKREELDSQLSSMRREAPLKMLFPSLIYQNKRLLATLPNVDYFFSSKKLT